MGSECKPHEYAPIPIKQSLMVHIVKAVDAVLFRFMRICSADPHGRRVAIGKAEEIAYLERSYRLCLHGLKALVAENMYQAVVLIACIDHLIERCDHPLARDAGF